VVQLRQDNKDGTAFNMVGFQTRMAYSEQVRVFRMIPGLENAEFLKLGSIHRNLFINSPKRLNKDLSSKNDPWLFFAGQITGVEGYFESTCVGLLVAKFLDQKLKDKPFSPPPRASAMGSLLEAITDETRADHFQPTNINFALLPPLEVKERDKEIRKKKQIEIARAALTSWQP
jgi:methylenetetrahydrofolate--tRNA-(uracil-5-)-methyltransferase